MIKKYQVRLFVKTDDGKSKRIEHITTIYAESKEAAEIWADKLRIDFKCDSYEIYQIPKNSKKTRINIDNDLIEMALNVMQRESKLFGNLIEKILYNDNMESIDKLIAYVIRRGISDMEHTISLFEEHDDEVKYHEL